MIWAQGLFIRELRIKLKGSGFRSIYISSMTESCWAFLESMLGSTRTPNAVAGKPHPGGCLAFESMLQSIQMLSRTSKFYMRWPSGVEDRMSALGQAHHWSAQKVRKAALPMQWMNEWMNVWVSNMLGLRSMAGWVEWVISKMFKTCGLRNLSVGQPLCGTG